MGVTLQNERQYEFTKTQLARLEAALSKAQEPAGERADVPAVVQQSHENSLRFLIDDLRAQLSDYERLRDGRIRSLSLHSVLDELPQTLVRARIARNWTHRELAQALGTSEQQVQKDEAGGYARASLDKLSRVAQALGVSLSGRASLTRRSPHRRVSKTARRKTKG